MDETTDKKRRTVILIGSGVLGLTTACILAETGKYDVTIVAKDMTEDMDSQGWASPWAGANWAPLLLDDPRVSTWETKTLKILRALIPDGLAMSLPCRVFLPDDSMLPRVWFQDTIPNYRVMDKEELVPGATFGIAFTTLSVHPPTYLPWLRARVEAVGVRFVKARLSSIEQALDYVPDTSQNVVVVNATGLGAKSLLGVEDKAVIPIRGQTVVVRAPDVKECVVKVEDGYVSYIIPRTDGTVILGGTQQEGSWDTSMDSDTAARILRSCRLLIPALASATIVSHNVGLRPSRIGGPRVEKETITLPVAGGLNPSLKKHPSKILKVVHAYGIGPAGYQSSWGLAEDAASLVDSYFEG